MAYVSKIWVDRQTEYPTRRKLEFDDGSSDKIVTVSREEGTIYEAGDTFDANTMNSLESRIAAGIAEKQDILIAGNGIRIDQDNVISATGGGGGIEFTKIESGSLVSVNDAADLPVVDLAVEIKAIQSGTGDPSPNNVRPILGRSNVNMTRTGANLWDEVAESGNIYTSNGQPVADNTKIRSSNFCPIKEGLTLYGVSSGLNQLVIYFYASDFSYLGFANATNRTVSVVAGACYFKIVCAVASYSNDISINYPSTDTAYHTYTGTTVTIALDQTVYGGERNITSGLQTVTHGMVTFDGGDDETWSIVGSGDNRRFRTTITDLGASLLKQSSAFVPVNTNSGTWGQARIASNVLNLLDNTTQIADVAALKTWLAANKPQFVYELATPVTVQLTPTEIETLLGINNIWADTGEILNLEYYTTSASDVRDFIIKDDMVSDQSSWSSDKITEELDTKQDIIEAGDGIVINGNEISAVLYKELTATLNVFSTSVVFEDSAITTSSVIDIYTSKYGFNPETVTAETGRLTITFRQPEEQITVKVRIS